MQYVSLGKSGLKVSRIILGCMTYGSKKWSDWVIEDQAEVNKHIQFAYDNGIQTFDTANVYSNGLSEIALGRAIRELNLPRDELVIMTKVCFTSYRSSLESERVHVKLYCAIAKDPGVQLFDARSEDYGIMNQKGLSRKVCVSCG